MISFGQLTSTWIKKRKRVYNDILNNLKRMKNDFIEIDIHEVLHSNLLLKIRIKIQIKKYYYFKIHSLSI